jgi:hypothetical protein
LCKVPLIPLISSTDSASYSGSLTTSDCRMPPGDFNANDSSQVELYSMRMSDTASRTLYFNSSTPLIILVGPTYDTFASLLGSHGASVTAQTNGSLEFYPGVAGDYSIIVGTYSYATNVSYSLTIGAEHAPTAAAEGAEPSTRFSRSQSLPPVGPRRLTPLSGAHRGR